MVRAPAVAQPTFIVLAMWQANYLSSISIAQVENAQLRFWFAHLLIPTSSELSLAELEEALTYPIGKSSQEQQRRTDHH